jgi:hypothetical protein
MPANPYKTVVDEVTNNGGPTDKCCRIFKTIGRRGAGITEREYWMAVREGTTRHRWRKKRNGS